MADATLAAADQWLRKAERDLAAARRLMLGETPLRDTGVYHCQQAVEKGLKAFLTYHNTSHQKTHNLVALLDVAETIDPTFARWLEAAKMLTPYATEFRYPGEIIEPTAEEAAKALQHAEDFLNFLAEKLRRGRDS